jgi:hypothetical protein
MAEGDKFEQCKKDNPIQNESDMFQATPKSSVKLIKNSRGINWDIKVVEGETKLMEDLMLEAIRIHKKLVEEFE